MIKERALILSLEDIWTFGIPKCHGCKFLVTDKDHLNERSNCIILSCLEKQDDWNLETRNGQDIAKDFICSKCPFNNVPEPKNIVRMRYPQPDGLNPEYKKGWNDALKALHKDVIENPDAEYCKDFLIKVSDDIIISVDNSRFECECGCYHFTKRISRSGSSTYTCNECRAVYMTKG